MKGLKYPPFATPAPHGELRRMNSPEVLPSIDEFLDELPSIDDFLDVDAPEAIAETQDFSAAEPASSPEAQSEEGWAAGSWQSYDWGSLSSLNRSSVDAGDSTWGDADWPEPSPTSAPRPTQPGTTPSADEVADALDGIARRIRTGELVIDNLHGTRPEVAMAAALTILLRMRG